MTEQPGQDEAPNTIDEQAPGGDDPIADAEQAKQSAGVRPAPETSTESSTPVKRTFWQRFLYEENYRALAAMIAASVVGIATSRIYPSMGRNHAMLIFATALLGGWSAFSATHAGLIWQAHRHLDARAFRRAVLSDRASLRDREGLGEAMLGRTTTSFASSVVTMALTGVMVLVLFPELRGESLLLFMGAALVVIAWIDLALTFAMQYARLNLTQPGLVFPGDEGLTFDDYQYFGMGVQATFGTTDVSVTTTQMRTAVRHHGLMAFCFNSVIVAMLVSLVLTLS